jgi:hypothetical protein
MLLLMGRRLVVLRVRAGVSCSGCVESNKSMSSEVSQLESRFQD